LAIAGSKEATHKTAAAMKSTYAWPFLFALAPNSRTSMPHLPFRRKRSAPQQPSKRCLSGQDRRRALGTNIDLFDNNIIQPGGTTRTKKGCNPLNREL